MCINLYFASKGESEMPSNSDYSRAITYLGPDASSHDIQTLAKEFSMSRKDHIDHLFDPDPTNMHEIIKYYLHKISGPLSAAIINIQYAQDACKNNAEIKESLNDSYEDIVKVIKITESMRLFAKQLEEPCANYKMHLLKEDCG